MNPILFIIPFVIVVTLLIILFAPRKPNGKIEWGNGGLIKPDPPKIETISSVKGYSTQRSKSLTPVNQTTTNTSIYPGPVPVPDSFDTITQMTIMNAVINSTDPAPTSTVTGSCTTEQTDFGSVTTCTTDYGSSSSSDYGSSYGGDSYGGGGYDSGGGGFDGGSSGGGGDF